MAAVTDDEIQETAGAEDNESRLRTDERRMKNAGTWIESQNSLRKRKFRTKFGLARHAGLAKGQMLGDEQRLLKLLFAPDSLRLLLVLRLITESGQTSGAC